MPSTWGRSFFSPSISQGPAGGRSRFREASRGSSTYRRTAAPTRWMGGEADGERLAAPAEVRQELRPRDVLPGVQLEVLVTAGVIAVLRDEHAAPELRRCRAAGHRDPLHVIHVVDRARLGIDDPHEAVSAGPFVQQERVVSLARGDEI